MHTLRKPHESTLQSSRTKSAKSIGFGALFFVFVLTGCAGSGSPDNSTPTTVAPATTPPTVAPATTPPTVAPATTMRHKIKIGSEIAPQSGITDEQGGMFYLRCAEYTYYKWSDTGEEFSEIRRFKVPVGDKFPSYPMGICKGF